jgi:hypothetical protein
MDRIILRTGLAASFLVLLAACGGSLRAPADGPGSAEPVAAVERFLNLAAVPDYIEMGWMFGTDRGPIIRRDPQGDVERRMYAIATVLKNDEHEIRSHRPVPGRTGSAVEVNVALRQGQRDHLVPFTVVRGPGGRWFIEQVRLEAITGR